MDSTRQYQAYKPPPSPPSAHDAHPYQQDEVEGHLHPDYQTEDPRAPLTPYANGASPNPYDAAPPTPSFPGDEKSKKGRFSLSKKNQKRLYWYIIHLGTLLLGGPHLLTGCSQDCPPCHSLSRHCNIIRSLQGGL